MNGYQQYSESKVTTASKGKLLLMAYDGAIRFIRLAQGHMETKRYEDQNMYILKAQRILLELISTLNMKADPDLANQLLSVYEYMFNRLVEANITDNIEVLHEVEKHLLDLRSAWEEADHQLTISQAEEGKANNAIYASG